MKPLIFSGSAVALVTPFSDDIVNFTVLEQLLRYHIENGSDAIMVCGTTGEAATMTPEEKHEIYEFAVKTVAGKVPVIGGAGTNATKDAVVLARYARDAGVDAVMIVTPYYNKATPKGLYEHYKTIADEVGVPIIIYNVPSRTGLNMDASTVAEIAEIPNIVGIKEASGDIVQVTEIQRTTPPDFTVYSGNDDYILPVLSIGGKGVISTVANIAPKETSDLVKNFLNGNIEQSRELQFKLLPLIKALFIEVNPQPVKTSLRLLGFPVGNVRLPLTSMEASNEKILRQALTDFGFSIK